MKIYYPEFEVGDIVYTRRHPIRINIYKILDILNQLYYVQELGTGTYIENMDQWIWTSNWDDKSHNFLHKRIETSSIQLWINELPFPYENI